MIEPGVPVPAAAAPLSRINPAFLPHLVLPQRKRRHQSTKPGVTLHACYGRAFLLSLRLRRLHVIRAAQVYGPTIPSAARPFSL